MFYKGKRVCAKWAAIAAVTFLVGSVANVRATSYAYSVQQTSNYTISGATVGTVTPFTSSSAAQNASPSGSESQVGAADTLQSYVGPAPNRPAENFFTPKGQTTPDYSRGDASVATAPGALATNNVAEGFLAGGGIATGTGAWSLSLPLTVTAAGTVTLSFNFTNQLNLTNTTPASLAADFSYTFEIRNSAGTVVFNSSPSAVNQNASLVSVGNIFNPSSGSISITTPTLAPGSYTGTISGSEHVFINAVPEPSSYMLLACGAAAMAGLVLRRKRPIR